jgi:hypothetical protein
MNSSVSRLIIVLVLAVFGAGAYYWWQARQPSPVIATEVPAVTTAPLIVASEPLPIPLPAASAASAPVIQFPVPRIEKAVGAPDQALPALADSQSYISSALTDLLGRKNVLTFLQLDIFARRAVATIDNLARSHAPLTLWPVNPTPGRFTTLADAGNSEARVVISPDNGLRYTPLVLFVESVNTTQAMALYVRLYPLFQQAYEELGYPGRYFNDRFVAVLDQLLSTPVQTGPITVSLVDVNGPYPMLRPWVRYEFTDPALEALSSGQKMLVRTGPVNHRRLNTKMLELRSLIAGAALHQSTGGMQVKPKPQPPVIRY